MKGIACGENILEETRKLILEHGPLAWINLVVDGQAASCSSLRVKAGLDEL